MRRVRLKERLLDGGRPWGSLEVSPSRYGVARYQLVVFPPGISREERMLVRIYRSWGSWALAMWMGLVAVVTPAIGPAAGLAFSTTFCLTVIGTAWVLSGSVRGGVRTMTVVRMPGVYDADTHDALAQLSVLALTLRDADTRRASGALDPVGHEAVVWRVYEQMPGGRQSDVRRA